MKTKLIIAFCFFNLFISAQPYKSILGNSIAKWTIMYLPNYEMTQEWITNGEEIINGIKYKVLSQYTTDMLYIGGSYYNKNIDVTDSVWRFTIPNMNNLQGERFIRESADASRLYLYDKTRNEEYTISDLNLQKGDTFYLPGSSQNIFHWQSNYALVDSVYSVNGIKRVQLNIYTRFEGSKLTFIEGIGPNLGIFYIYGGVYANPDVYCLQCFQNSETFYKQLSDKPCVYDWNVTAIKTVFENSFQLIQNKNELTMLFKTNGNRVVSFYDMTGKVIYRKTHFNCDKVFINSNSLLIGNYILSIINSQNIRENSGRIITIHKP